VLALGNEVLENYNRVRLWRTNWMMEAEADTIQDADADVVKLIGARESLQWSNQRTSDSFMR
jgi:hypothetical protein